MDVGLRVVAESDLPIFFEHQCDPEAARLAAFPARDLETFLAHWAKVLSDDTTTKMTILVDGAVAGNIVSFDHAGKREIGYWLGRVYWGRGIATRAVSAFVSQAPERPLYAGIAKHNVGSIRVLEKCGFVRVGEDHAFATWDEQVVEGVILELA